MMRVWTQEIIPEDWPEGLVIPLLKKGDLWVFNNFRRITLLNAVSKILSALINQRLKPYIAKGIGDLQQRFRLGKSTIYTIDIVNQIAIATTLNYNHCS